MDYRGFCDEGMKWKTLGCMVALDANMRVLQHHELHDVQARSVCGKTYWRRLHGYRKLSPVIE